MNENVLFVDDEPSVLDGIRRQLRKQVQVHTAIGGEEGLIQLDEAGPFAVVVADMRMPRMNGAEFLGKVRERSPDSVRIVLSGQSDLESTIAAVNSGQLFRFLTKPCSSEELLATVRAGIEQHRLIDVERELLENTLSGAVNTLMEILSMTNPVAFGRASRIRRYAQEMATVLGIQDDWQFRLAATLSQIGCVTLPGDTLAKVYAGQELTSEEAQLYDSHPEVAGKLLSSIPRLEGVADMITGQCRQHDTSTLPDDPQQWEATVLVAEVLRAAAEFDRLIGCGADSAHAMRKLQDSMPGQLSEAVSQIKVAAEEAQIKLVTVGQLLVGMVLDEDLMSANGICLMSSGHEITQSTIIRLRGVTQGVGITEPFRVKVFR